MATTSREQASECRLCRQVLREEWATSPPAIKLLQREAAPGLAVRTTRTWCASSTPTSPAARIFSDGVIAANR